jgi:hypothetical protein
MFFSDTINAANQYTTASLIRAQPQLQAQPQPQNQTQSTTKTPALQLQSRIPRPSRIPVPNFTSPASEHASTSVTDAKDKNNSETSIKASPQPLAQVTVSKSTRTTSQVTPIQARQAAKKKTSLETPIEATPVSASKTTPLKLPSVTKSAHTKPAKSDVKADTTSTPASQPTKRPAVPRQARAHQPSASAATSVTSPPDAATSAEADAIAGSRGAN